MQIILISDQLKTNRLFFLILTTFGEPKHLANVAIKGGMRGHNK